MRATGRGSRLLLLSSSSMALAEGRPEGLFAGPSFGALRRARGFGRGTGGCDWTDESRALGAARSPRACMAQARRRRIGASGCDSVGGSSCQRTSVTMRPARASGADSQRNAIRPDCLGAARLLSCDSVKFGCVGHLLHRVEGEPDLSRLWLRRGGASLGHDDECVVLPANGSAGESSCVRLSSVRSGRCRSAERPEAEPSAVRAAGDESRRERTTASVAPRRQLCPRSAAGRLRLTELRRVLFQRRVVRGSRGRSRR